MFSNERWFKDPESRRQAMGHKTAVVDGHGQPVFYTGTGGLLSPQRLELPRGSQIYRFADSKTSANNMVVGSWWSHRRAFEKISSFAQEHDINIAFAARHLMCVPPEWSDMGMLVRARVREPLLAYKGIAKDVNIKDQHGPIKMTAHNDLAARRLEQLFIPGLRELAAEQPNRIMPGSLVAEQIWQISVQETVRGFLYL